MSNLTFEPIDIFAIFSKLQTLLNMKKELLTIKEMKQALAATERTKRPSANAVDCCTNPNGQGDTPLSYISMEYMAKHHYPTKHERQMACLQ